MSQPFLEVRAGESVNRFPLGEDPVVIGRQSDCAIVLADSKSSRKHASITLRGQKYWIRDLESSNGTLLNGKRISSAPLSPGDVIAIGNVTIKFADASTADVEDEAEMLGDDDIVEIEEEVPSHGMPTLLPDGDPEQSLEALANALPDQNVREGDIIFLNSRGQALHATPSDRKPGAKREPVDLFRLLMLVCLRARSTDIHLEPRSDGYQLRLRIDGSMVDVAKLPQNLGVRIATMVKVLSDIDIGQRNTMQEGHFAAKVPSQTTSGRRVDYRVSFAPSVFGQKLVVRILDAENAPLKLGDLHLPRWMYEALHEQTGSDSGMILVSGPTGSGKTTTLYSLLRSIELHRRNVVTIEDPVEVQIESTTQIPVDEEQGKSFSAILRSVLRQDPDVIMLGEIRDAETARTAMQAAMTGHMVLSTIHTRDTLGTIFRLLDLGVEPFLVSQGLHVVVAQRLARQLCPFCRKKVALSDEQRALMGPTGQNLQFAYAPGGCTKCLGTGHAGRRAFFELLRTNDALRELILKNPSMPDLQKALADTPFVTLAQSGYQLVIAGVVAFDEIERIVGREGRVKA